MKRKEETEAAATIAAEAQELQEKKSYLKFGASEEEKQRWSAQTVKMDPEKTKVSKKFHRENLFCCWINRIKV